MMPSGPWWPVALGVAIRIAVWALVPASRFASDESSYFHVGTALAARGERDLFWPPMTGWVIAIVTFIAGPSVPALRFVWVLLDIACLLSVRALAWRLARAMSGGDSPRLADDRSGQVALARRFATWATLGYAIYLPAVSFAQFTTSETPALLQLLAVLLLLTKPSGGSGTFALAGAVTGTLALTRPSLLPLLALLPLVTVPQTFRSNRWRHAVVFVAAGSVVVGAVVFQNWRSVGEATIARNNAYNLFIGNRDFYAEDLDLFNPRATPAQVEFRRQMLTGEEPYPSGTPDELQRQAFAWITSHPGTFVRRALGRLGRVFAPRTDVLELVGGERAAGVFSPQSIAVLGVANLQWTLILFGGIAGLFALRHRDRDLFVLFTATIAGSVVLCLIAISKPRYSFVFDPLLLLCACAFLLAPRQGLASLGRAERWIMSAVFVFLIWSWIAWMVFALTSRP